MRRSRAAAAVLKAGRAMLSVSWLTTAPGLRRHEELLLNHRCSGGERRRTQNKKAKGREEQERKGRMGHQPPEQPHSVPRARCGVSQAASQLRGDPAASARLHLLRGVLPPSRRLLVAEGGTEAGQGSSDPGSPGQSQCCRVRVLPDVALNSCTRLPCTKPQNPQELPCWQGAALLLPFRIFPLCRSTFTPKITC